MAYVLINLTEFAAKKEFGQFVDERQKWCYTIKNMWRLSEEEISASDTSFHELYEDCKLSKPSKIKKKEYEKSILGYEDVQDAIAYQHKLGWTRASMTDSGKEWRRE